MEIVFKNRPAPNIEINEVEEGTSLEITSVETIVTGKQYKSRVVTNKKSLSALIEMLSFVLESWKLHKRETSFDKLQAKIIGPDSGPDFIELWSDHVGLSGRTEETGVRLPKEAGPRVLAALERWRENPSL